MPFRVTCLAMGGKTQNGSWSTRDEVFSQVYEVVRQIPRGNVTTYGQLAILAGFPGGARVAARALKMSRPEHGLPWHRVIGKASGHWGRIAILDPVGAAMQIQMLRTENVEVNDKERVDLRRHGWRPWHT